MQPCVLLNQPLVGKVLGEMRRILSNANRNTRRRYLLHGFAKSEMLFQYNSPTSPSMGTLWGKGG